MVSFYVSWKIVSSRPSHFGTKIAVTKGKQSAAGISLLDHPPYALGRERHEQSNAGRSPRRGGG
jgi:hypothetical protein